jgi:hypothetical protein
MRYSKDLLLQLRANANTDSTFINSLNMPKKEKTDDELSGSDDNHKSTPKIKERELDEHRLGQRQKQIEYGKNTVGYIKFAEQVK